MWWSEVGSQSTAGVTPVFGGVTFALMDTSRPVTCPFRQGHPNGSIAAG